MIPNIVNALLGVWLTYAGVFLVNRNGGIDVPLLVAGAVIVGLSLWARRTDVLRWVAPINSVLGLLLIGFAALHMAAYISQLEMFWGVFWVGIVVGVLALWAALYRPDGLTDATAPSRQE